MRSSLLPRRRPLERICDACQQRRELSSSPNRSIWIFNKPAPSSSSWTTSASISRRSKTPTASLLSNRAFSQTRDTRTAEAASRQPPADSSSQQQQQQQQQQEQQSASSRSSSQVAAAAVAPTHYDLFPETLATGPPPDGPFAVDVPALRREFLRLQAVAHPDMHPPGLKARAEAASARINEAYKTLCSPLLRAQYLLELRGGPDVAGDETAKVEDPDLLMEVLEARERIEEAASEEDLRPLRDENAARERASEDVLARCFAAGDLEAAAREAVRLRYWVNIRESIDGWERGKPVVLEH